MDHLDEVALLATLLGHSITTDCVMSRPDLCILRSSSLLPKVSFSFWWDVKRGRWVFLGAGQLWPTLLLDDSPYNLNLVSDPVPYEGILPLARTWAKTYFPISGPGGDGGYVWSTQAGGFLVLPDKMIDGVQHYCLAIAGTIHG